MSWEVYLCATIILFSKRNFFLESLLRIIYFPQVLISITRQIPGSWMNMTPIIINTNSHADAANYNWCKEKSKQQVSWHLPSQIWPRIFEFLTAKIIHVCQNHKDIRSLILTASAHGGEARYKTEARTIRTIRTCNQALSPVSFGVFKAQNWDQNSTDEMESKKVFANPPLNKSCQPSSQIHQYQNGTRVLLKNQGSPRSSTNWFH